MEAPSPLGSPQANVGVTARSLVAEGRGLPSSSQLRPAAPSGQPLAELEVSHLFIKHLENRTYEI